MCTAAAIAALRGEGGGSNNVCCAHTFRGGESRDGEGGREGGRDLFDSASFL